MISKRQLRKCIVFFAQVGDCSAQILLNRAVPLEEQFVQSHVASKGWLRTLMVSCLLCSQKLVSRTIRKFAAISSDQLRYFKGLKINQAIFVAHRITSFSIACVMKN